MLTNKPVRLWRVEWVHRNGYQAPYIFVEAKKRKEALGEVENLNSRLGKFPENWSFILIRTELIRSSNGKFVKELNPKSETE